MSESYQRVTVTVIVKDEDVESAKRELHLTLEQLDEEYGTHSIEVVAEECDDPEDDEDLFEYEDAA